MPSDLAKKKAAKKKEAAKARQRTKKPDELNEEGDQPEAQSNGAESNGKRTDLWLNVKNFAGIYLASNIQEMGSCLASNVSKWISRNFY